MKNIYTFLILVCSAFIQVNAQSYCVENLSYYGCSYSAAIDSFQLSNINQIATGCTGGTGIADYTGDTCILSQGEPYVFSYTTNTSSWNASSDRLGIWIDFNNDFDFDDPGEFIYGSPAGGIKSDLISIALSANLGFHRMRVRCINDYSPINATQSCYGYFYYSETQDYTVNIVPPPPCPSVNTVTVSNIGLHNAEVGWFCDGCNGRFIIEYGLPGFSPGNSVSAGAGGTVIEVASMAALPVTLSGLNSSTDYQVYVRRDCAANGFSSNYGPINFITDYDACATLTSISCGIPVDAIIPTGHGAYDTTNCGVNTGKEMLYSFTAEASGIYTLTILNSDGRYAAYMIKEASLGCNGTGWNCGQTYPWDFNFSSPGTIILDTLQAGTTYLLCIDALYDMYGASHTFQIDCYTPFNPCDTITQIECGVPQQATIPPGLGAFTNYNNNYSANFGKEKIFNFTPVITGIYTLTINSNVGYYAAYYSYKKASEGCDINNWHFISGAGGAPYTILMGTLLAGTEYYLLVDAYSMVGVDQNFQIDCATPSDPCTSIQPISCGTTVNVNIPPGAGNILLPTCPDTWAGTQYMGKEAIFEFTAATSGFASLHILTNTSPNWDNYFYYYIKPASGGCSATGWTCLGPGYTGWYNIPFTLNTGESYYIMVDAKMFNGNTQSFEITCPEPYDPCSTITPIACATSYTATIPAGVSAWDDFCNNNYSHSFGKELIYSFTAELSGTYAINITATDYKQVKYLLKDASDGCNSEGWNCIIMNAYPSSGQPVFIPYPLDAGHNYYLMLDAADPTGATHTFDLQCVYPADPCANITSIACGNENTVVNEHGLGVFDPPSSFYGHFPGRETIFEFTPSISGNHLLEILSTAEYSTVGYFIKPATEGCSNNNWSYISAFSYPGVAGFPYPLNAGISYYIMADSYTPGQTFRIVCPETTYDYCSTLETIASCATPVTFTIPPGLGAFGSPNSCYHIATPGKEKLFAFTPPMTAYYGLKVTSGTGNSINYYLREASAGCDVNGWTCIENLSSWGGAARTPFRLIAGTAYYILADATDTLGASQTVEIVCPSADPCNSIENIPGCYSNITLSMPEGFNDYDLSGCGTNYQTQNSPIGSAKIYSFTPTENGINGLGSNIYNDYNIRFFIKPASMGCDGNNWSCADVDLTRGNINLPFMLDADTTYYLMVVNAYNYASYQYSFYFICPSPCIQYADRDGDGYGNDQEVLYTCWPNFGYVYDGGDCNDLDPSVNPGIIEILGNNVDDNCNGLIDEVPAGYKTLNLSLFLESLYDGGSTMRKAQNALGSQFSGSIADQVKIELHSAANYSVIDYSANIAILNTNGTLAVVVPSGLTGSYYITVKHRSSIETTSATAVSFASPSVTYNFDNASKAFGSNLKLVSGKYCIYGGDVNQDGIVDSGDMIPIDNLSSNFGTGYIPEDTNGDGLVDSGDMIIVDNNSSNFVGAITP